MANTRGVVIQTNGVTQKQNSSGTPHNRKSTPLIFA